VANFFLAPILQIFGTDGNPAAGAKVNCFAAGTTTPLATFTDASGGTPLANPVLADSLGRVQIWLSPVSYKFVVTTSTGVALFTIDNFNYANVNTTLASLTVQGTTVITNPTAATALANQSSPTLTIQGQYWNGTASANDNWVIASTLGSGTNPTSTLTISHSGSSGTSIFSFPSATFGNITVANLTATGVVLGKNIGNVRYADQFANGSTTGGIQEAIADCPIGGTVYVPWTAAGYQLTAGSSTELILINKPIKLIGCGWNGNTATGGTLVVAAGIASTIDVIHILSSAAIEGLEISGLQILPASGTPARNGINIDTTVNPISKLNIHDNYIGTFGGKAIVSTNPTPLLNGFFTSWIRRNVLQKGMTLQNAGDTIQVRDNIIPGTGIGIDATFVSGVQDFIVSGNNVTTTGAGLHIGAPGINGLRLINNEFEGQVGVTGSNGAYVDIDGATGTGVSTNPVITGNQIAAVATNIHGLRLNWVDAAVVRDNWIPNAGGTAKCILITANAVAASSYIGPNYYTPTNTTQANAVSDSASSEIEWIFPYSSVANGGIGAGFQFSRNVATPTIFANGIQNQVGGNVITVPSPTAGGNLVTDNFLGKFTLYNSIAVAGNAIPSIYGATSQKAESAADANVLTFTPPAVAGTYRLRFVLSISAAASAVVGWTATWTDSNGSARTPANLSLFLEGTAAPALTFTTSAVGNYYGDATIDINNSATAIVIKFTLASGTITAKASATIERLI
jgi:hypothetical protein